MPLTASENFAMKLVVLVSEKCHKENSLGCSSYFSLIGVKAEDVVRLKKGLQDGRNYLKIDYKTHISTSTPIADHCSTFALSDPRIPSWRSKCQHDHNDSYVHQRMARQNKLKFHLDAVIVVSYILFFVNFNVPLKKPSSLMRKYVIVCCINFIIIFN